MSEQLRTAVAPPVTELPRKTEEEKRAFLEASERAYREDNEVFKVLGTLLRE